MLATLVVVVGLGAFGWVPLFGGPGYEISLVAGLLLPPTAAVLVAVERVGARHDPFGSFCHGVGRGALLALAGYLTTLAHGLRVGFCDLWGGSMLFGLGPALGAILGGLWGAVAAEWLGPRLREGRRTLAAGVLGAAGPVSSAVLQLALFYATPMVFAFDPFVGYFSGTLYDTVLDPAGLVTYRAATACTLCAAYVASLHLEHTADGRRLRLRRLGRPGLVATGVLAWVASLATVALGPRLGHWQTASSIRRELGAVSQVGRCEVVYDRAIAAADAQRLGRDCDGHLDALGRWFQVELPPTVSVYLFFDAAQKRQLMGAAGTSIAKPWRREIYIQQAGYPHPSLGHELAHVVAGQYGQGPFRVAGHLAGWLPDPGRIEGVAVASQSPDSELSDREWAKAMREIGVLPRPAELFGLSFFGSHAAAAYTTAGAFVAFVHDQYGAPLVGRWYGGESLESLTARSWSELEGEWHSWLDQVTLSESALAQARARFDRPGVFARRCPHVVDELLGTAGGAEARGDLVGAIDGYRQAFGLDPTSGRARLSHASCLDAAGKTGESVAALEAMSAMDRLGRATRDNALEQLGDLALRRGDYANATALYQQVRSRVLDEDRLRNLDVKELACREPLTRPAIIALLVGTDRRGPLDIEAIDLLATWRRMAPEDGLPDYLVARRYLDAGRLERAAERIDEALAGQLALGRVRAEALRMQLVLGCARGEGEAAQRAFAGYARQPTVAPTQVAWAAALLARCSR